jgi:hypothetical protein
VTGGGDTGTARRGPFAVDEVAALAALEEAWAPAGYGAFGVADGTWSTIASGGEILTGATPDELDRKVRAHWQAMQ